MQRSNRRTCTSCKICMEMLIKFSALQLLAWVVVTARSFPSHPSVLLIVLDDLRPTMGCYGDATAFTPAMDALAEAGVKFNRAFAQQALCGPSRTSFLTSRRPSSTGVVDVHSYWRSHHNYTSLPQHFKQHGYYTVSAGKVFHPGIVSNNSDDAPYSWSATPFHPSTQQYKNAPICGVGRNATNVVCPVNVWEQPEHTLPDLQTVHYAISFLHRWGKRQLRRQWLRQYAGTGKSNSNGEGTSRRSSQRFEEEPFLLAVGFHKPHIPLKFPQEFLNLFPLSGIPLPPDRRLPSRLPPVAYNPWNDLRWRDDIARLNLTFPYEPIPDDYARLITQSYYAAVSYADLLLGELLAAAGRLFPNTVVALLGDHGWSLGEHQEWSKFSNYEVATRVPLIFAPLWRWKEVRCRQNVKRPLTKKEKNLGRDGIFKTLHKQKDGQKTNHPPRPVMERVTERDDRQEVYEGIRRWLGSVFPRWGGEEGRLGYERYWRLDDGGYNGGQRVGDDGSSLTKCIQMENCKSYADQFYNAQYYRERRDDAAKYYTTVFPMKSNYSYDGVVELVDLLPTLADLTGIEMVPSCHEVAGKESIGGKRIPKLQESIPAVLCTEGRSLASIIIDNVRSHLSDVKENSVACCSEVKLDNITKNNITSNASVVNHQRHKNNTFNSIHPAVSNDNITSGNKFANNNCFVDKSCSVNNSSLVDACHNDVINSSHWTLLCCVQEVRTGRVAVSQYPRPTLTPSVHPDSDQPRLTETRVMGYSLRSRCYRYTTWVAFNSTAFVPDFNVVLGEELYDHRTDPGEDRNVLWGGESATTKISPVKSIWKGGESSQDVLRALRSRLKNVVEI